MSAPAYQTQLGDRVVITLYRQGLGSPEPFEAAGVIVRLVDGTRPPIRPVLAYVRLDDIAHGERAIGVSSLRPEKDPT